MMKQQGMYRKKRGQGGFTLLEILVVVAIMGFLVAMVAPRFAGITSGTSATVCNTSKGRGAQMVSIFFEQNNRYPSGLVNLVMTDGEALAGARYQVPYVDDETPENGKEVLRRNHNNNFRFMIHHLNEDEAQELRDLGITRLYNLNHYGENLRDMPAVGQTVGVRTDADATGRTSNWQNVTVPDPDNHRPYMEAVAPAAGVAVIMSTIGANADGEFEYLGRRGTPSGSNNYFGRIIFGLGPESELVTSGMATRAGISPTAGNSDDFVWGGYYLVMPRLGATVDRLKAAGVTLTNINQSGQGGHQNLHGGFLSSGEVLALGFPRGTSLDPVGTNVHQDNPGKFTERVVNLLQPMESWQFDTNPVHEDLRWAIVWGHDPN